MSLSDIRFNFVLGGSTPALLDNIALLLDVGSTNKQVYFHIISVMVVVSLLRKCLNMYITHLI